MAPPSAGKQVVWLIKPEYGWNRFDNKIYDALSGYRDALNGFRDVGYEVRILHGCTLKQFKEIYTDPTTAGFFIASHGFESDDQPEFKGIQLDRVGARTSDSLVPNKSLLPKEVATWPRGENLKVAGFICCNAEDVRSAYAQAMGLPDDHVFSTENGTILSFFRMKDVIDAALDKLTEIDKAQKGTSTDADITPPGDDLPQSILPDQCVDNRINDPTYDTPPWQDQSAPANQCVGEQTSKPVDDTQPPRDQLPEVPADQGVDGQIGDMVDDAPPWQDEPQSVLPDHGVGDQTGDTTDDIPPWQNEPQSVPQDQGSGDPKGDPTEGTPPSQDLPECGGQDATGTEPHHMGGTNAPVDDTTDWQDQPQIGGLGATGTEPQDMGGTNAPAGLKLEDGSSVEIFALQASEVPSE